MIHYNKIGLLVLNKKNTKFLVCEKHPHNVTSNYIMPGGQFDEESIQKCLKNEIKEELNCQVDFNSLKYIGEYTDIAAGDPNKNVSIKLYQAKLIGLPKPSTEIKALHWIGKNDQPNLKVSPIIRNKIIPDLVKKRILS